MRFLLDVCAASRRLHSMLVFGGHDVVSALDVGPRASDVELLAFAFTDQRVVITEDKDFGRLVFQRGQPHYDIIRLTQMPVDEQVESMRQLLLQYQEETGDQRIIVVTSDRIRVRRSN